MDDFTKQPSEKFTISIDFSNNLSTSTNETISSYTVTAYLNNNDITSNVVDDYSLDEDGEIVYIKVKEGISGLDYKITVVATTDSTNVYEKDVLMRVREV